MILDNERQRAQLLQMFDGVAFPGKSIEEAYVLKRAIASAAVDMHEAFRGKEPPENLAPSPPPPDAHGVAKLFNDIQN